MDTIPRNDFILRNRYDAFCKAVLRNEAKDLQYIMGHANIVMTLNYYAHATFNSAQAEMERLEAAKAETAVAAAETTVENTEETKAAA